MQNNNPTPNRPRPIPRAQQGAGQRPQPRQQATTQRPAVRTGTTQARPQRPTQTSYQQRSPRPKKKSAGFGVFLLMIGLVMELFAGGLYAYNMYIQAEAEKAAQQALVDMQNGTGTYDWLGIISVPSANIELPVISSWDNEKLKVSACRYDGSIESNNLIICAHNYKAHFGRLDWISVGDQVTFTQYGVTYTYAVSEVTEVSGNDVRGMYSGDWDLTLYTCNYSGAGRITIRCKLVG